MYKVEIKQLDEEGNVLGVVYTQAVEKLDVPSLICDVMNNSEYGDERFFSGEEYDENCDEFGHEHGCPLSPASEPHLIPAEDFPFGTIVKGFRP